MDFDWDAIREDVSRYSSDHAKTREDFAHDAKISISAFDDVMCGKPVSEEVLRCIYGYIGSKLTPPQSYPPMKGSNQTQFEIPTAVPPDELRSGAFLLHQRAFEIEGLIDSALLILYHDAQLGRTRFAAVSVRQRRDDTTLHNRYSGFVWHAPEAGGTQLVDQEKGHLRVVSLARPMAWTDGDRIRRVRLRGTIQTFQQIDDKQLYPAISPVLMENLGWSELSGALPGATPEQIADELRAGRLPLPDYVGSFSRGEERMREIDQQLSEIGTFTLPAFHGAPTMQSKSKGRLTPSDSALPLVTPHNGHPPTSKHH